MNNTLVIPNLTEGFDIGNAYANFSNMKFATKVKIGKKLELDKRIEVHQVNYNGVDYVVGDGKAVMGEFKYSTDAYKLCVLTAIALKSGRKRNVRAKICLGLPIMNFERKVEEVRSIIESWGVQELAIKDENTGKYNTYTIEIVDLKFFIEGALPVLNEDMSHQLTIDIGGGTINVVEWEDMSPVNYTTLDASITNMYLNIAEYLNYNYGGSFTTGDIEKIICKEKTVIPINQVPVDISAIYLMVQEFVDGVVSSIEEAKFKVGQVEKISIFGGGVYSTFKYFTKHYTHAEQVKDAQFVNSKILRLVAKM
mgnify:CR=1 FL=1|jgi:plasmid segregation protein ParM